MREISKFFWMFVIVKKQVLHVESFVDSRSSKAFWMPKFLGELFLIMGKRFT